MNRNIFIHLIFTPSTSSLYLKQKTYPNFLYLNIIATLIGNSYRHFRPNYGSLVDQFFAHFWFGSNFRVTMQWRAFFPIIEATFLKISNHTWSWFYVLFYVKYGHLIIFFIILLAVSQNWKTLLLLWTWL